MNDYPDTQSRNLQMFLISFLTLYIEMVLIRWIGVEVRIFAYLSNFILIACFLGFGIGCFQSHLPFRPLQPLIVLLAIFFFVATPSGITLIPFRYITQMLGGGFFGTFPIWGTVYQDTSGYGLLMVLGGGLTVVLFSMVVLCLVPFGRYVGALFNVYPDVITAYSINIGGSLAGIWAFTLLSYLRWPPWGWLVPFLIGFLYFIPRERSWRCCWLIVTCAIVLSLFPWNEGNKVTHWSPYQKLVVSPLNTSDNQLRRGFLIDVNNTGYQMVLNLSKTFLAEHPKYFNVKEAAFGPYDLPYRLLPNINKMLIVGTGAGNDCAAALRNGVRNIDCVEIDPVIAEIGKALHPERPYDNARVKLIIDDARSFFGKSKSKYDLIWFGLLDSHTLGSAYNNVRLDHYVYTRESFQAAKRLLNDNGVVVVFFESRTFFIAGRIRGLLQDAFGFSPLMFSVRSPDAYYGCGGTLYVTGKDDPKKLFEHAPAEIRNYLMSRREPQFSQVDLTTDDWPFLYLPSRGLPPLHLIMAGILIGIFMGYRNRILQADVVFDWKFFFLGAGFLLIEVQSVTKAGLAFGTTWIVNCFIVSQVLIWVLLSNLVYAKLRFNELRPIFGLLFADMAFIYFLPMDVFTGWTLVPKLVLVSLHLTMPVFFGGLIFINLFDKCRHKANALGANLIGALVGGLMEICAFVWGQKSLLVVAGGFYALALLLLIGSIGSLFLRRTQVIDEPVA